MTPTLPPQGSAPAQPILIGLTCWRWQFQKSKKILALAQTLGVTLQLTQRVHGLRREIEALVSGQNTDRFIHDFVRHC